MAHEHLYVVPAAAVRRSHVLCADCAGGRVNPDYYWALVPAVAALLLNAPDAGRVCVAVLTRVLRAGATWR